MPWSTTTTRYARTTKTLKGMTGEGASRVWHAWRAKMWTILCLCIIADQIMVTVSPGW